MDIWENRILSLARGGGAWVAELAAEMRMLQQERDEARECADDRLGELMNVQNERLRLQEALANVQAERDRLRTLIAEVASSGVEFDDDRLNYVTVQIPRPVWVDVRSSPRSGPPA